LPCRCREIADHCPPYRQTQILARQGITIDRATLAFWTGDAAAEVKPVWRLMREELLRSTNLFVDEAAAPVLDPGRGRTKKGLLLGAHPRRLALVRPEATDPIVNLDCARVRR
jgi:hypothetical protein